jgi:hypothetical protein
MNKASPATMVAPQRPARAAAQQRLAHVRETVTVTALVLVAAASLASAQPPCMPPDAAPPGTLAAEFTGRFQSGTPVYRLPRLTVTAGRNVTVVEGEARKPERSTRPPRKRVS